MLEKESLFFKNTQRNTFVVVAIKFPEQNTSGAAVYSLQGRGGSILSQIQWKRMFSNDFKSSPRVAVTYTSY